MGERLADAKERLDGKLYELTRNMLRMCNGNVEEAEKALLKAIEGLLDKANKQESAEAEAKFFITMNGWSDTVSLHLTKEKAVERLENYDGGAVYEVVIGEDKDLYVDSDEDSEKEKKKKKRAGGNKKRKLV